MKHKSIALLLSVSSLFSSKLALADILDVNISNDAVAMQYLVDMGQGFFAGGTILHEEDAGQVASVDLMVRDDLRSGAHTFTAGLGGRFMGVFTEAKGNDGGALALGGFGKYTLPEMKAISLKGELFYGPSVTAVEDIEGIVTYTFGVEVELIERAWIHANYRKIRVDFPGGKGDMDEGLNMGIKLEF